MGRGSASRSLLPLSTTGVVDSYTQSAQAWLDRTLELSRAKRGSTGNPLKAVPPQGPFELFGRPGPLFGLVRGDALPFRSVRVGDKRDLVLCFIPPAKVAAWLAKLSETFLDINSLIQIQPDGSTAPFTARIVCKVDVEASSHIPSDIVLRNLKIIEHLGVNPSSSLNAHPTAFVSLNGFDTTGHYLAHYKSIEEALVAPHTSLKNGRQALLGMYDLRDPSGPKPLTVRFDLSVSAPSGDFHQLESVTYPDVPTALARLGQLVSLPQV